AATYFHSMNNNFVTYSIFRTFPKWADCHCKCDRVQPARIDIVRGLIYNVRVSVKALRVADVHRAVIWVWACPSSGLGFVFAEPCVVETGSVVAFGQAVFLAQAV